MEKEEYKHIRVISAFAGMGKTTLANTYSETFCDIDPAEHKFILTKEQQALPVEQQKALVRERNPEWPLNYLADIKQKVASGKVVLISQHREILALLRQANISFVFVTPTHDSKSEYINRWQNRGNSEVYIQKRLRDFDEDIDYCLSTGEPHLFLQDNQYLTDIAHFWL